MLVKSRQLIVLSFAALATSVQAVFVNFDSFTGMNYLSGNPIPASARLNNQLLASHGVRFSSTAGYVAVVELPSGSAVSSPNGIGGSTAGGVLTYNSDDPIWITFHTNGDPNSLGVTDFVSIRGDLWGGGQPEHLRLTTH
jgi:hypothetical protein